MMLSSRVIFRTFLNVARIVFFVEGAQEVLLVEVVHVGPEVPCGYGSDVPAPEPLNETSVLLVEAPIHCLVGPDTPIALVGCLFFFLDEAEVIGFEGELPLRRLLLLKEGYGEVLRQFLGSDR